MLKILRQLWMISVSRQWHAHVTYSPAVTETGLAIDGFVMRRRVGGYVVYRAPDAGDLADAAMDFAIR